MTALEAIQLAASTGVLAGGLGLFKWGLAVERRLLKIEVRTGVEA